MEKRATQPDSMRKLFPCKLNTQTPKVPSEPSPTSKAKNQVKSHTQKHKGTLMKKKEEKEKEKIKDSKSPKKIGLPPNKR